MTYWGENCSYPVRPLLVFEGHCHGCGHGTAAQPDRQMVFHGSESAAEICVPPDATDDSVVGEGLTLAQAVKGRKLSEVQSLVCNACGTLHQKRRIRRPAHYNIVATIGVWWSLPIHFLGPFGWVYKVLLILASDALFVGVYAIVRHLRNPWTGPESCSGCNGGPLLPAVTTVGRKLPCPNCGERLFRYRDTARSTGD